MSETYIILTPTRPRRWFGARVPSAPRFSIMTGLAALSLSLPLAIGVSLYLLNSDEDMDLGANIEAAQLTLPDLPEASILAPASPVAAAPVLAPAMEMAVAPQIPTVEAPVETLVSADLSHRVIQLEWGDTLAGLLLEAAVPAAEAHEAMTALKSVYDPKDMQAGEEITLRYSDAGQFSGFEFEPNAEQAVRVERLPEGFKAASVLRPLSRNVMAASVAIEGSLYESGIKAGIPMGAMASLVKSLSYSVDFQRDIKAGDSFKVMYEVMRNPDGQLVRTGEILFAEVSLQGKAVQVYRYKFADGRVEYFDGKGGSVRKSLLRTPVNAARISSGFGMRRHPVMGYSRMHKGVDFAAPTGTPIYASGDGTIVERGWKGGYGNYIRIRHTGSTSTAYAHMSRFNNALSRGARVKQGQVIGYVGTTGRSTGPHLHYEVMVNGAQVNPLKVASLNSGEALKGSDMNRLKGIVESINGQFNKMELGRAIDVAFSAVTGEAVTAQVN